ncbi:MAG: SocA family protein [Chloroflexia bacterium]|nr:SocA family protein [Chloroflexia bacterium]
MAINRSRPAYNREFNRQKLEQVLLFFLHRANNPLLGKTKLMKLVYFADFDHFEEYETSITGARYRKLPQGPVPDEGMDAISNLEHNGRVSRTDIQKGSYIQHQYTPNEEVDLSLFSPTEIAVLEKVAARWREHSTEQIVSATHGEAPWVAVGMHREIPYYLAHYRNNFGALELDEDEALLDEDEVFAR